MIRILFADVRPLLEEELFEEKLALVAEVRRAKVTRFHAPMDRCRSLAAGLLLREGIRAAGIDYDQVQVVKGERGKPRICCRNFHYSLSHSGDYAAAAFAEYPLGMDIEQMGRVRSPERLLHRIATHREQEAAARLFSGERWDQCGESPALPQSEERARLGAWTDGIPEMSVAKPDENGGTEPGGNVSGRLAVEGVRLTCLWTRKEAFAKATGEGLAADFAQIETMENWTVRNMTLKGSTVEKGPGKGEGIRWMTETFVFVEGMWMSVCYQMREGSEETLSGTEIKF